MQPRPTTNAARQTGHDARLGRMSMVDNSRYRPYRPDDPGRREAATGDGGVSHGGGDPLAELARLIGQDDLFAEVKRNSAPPAPRDRAPSGEYREAAQTSRWPPARWFGGDSVAEGQAFDRTAREPEPADPHQDWHGTHQSYADTRVAYDTGHTQRDRYPPQPE